MRAVSTVLDVGLALVLVGAAIGVVVTGVPVTDRNDDATTSDVADGTARILSTTARVNYTVGHDPVEQHAHGSVASLLAAAAVRNATVYGEQLSGTAPEFRQGVRSIVRERSFRPGVAVAVRATWRPYPGAPISGIVHVGDRPPRDAAVSAATLTVPVGASGAREQTDAVDGSADYDRVARIAASGTVSVLFTNDGTVLGSTTASDLARRRYGALADELGVDLPQSRNATVLNDRLTSALAAEFETDLRDRFATPAAAARNLTVGRVHLVVRTWSP